ncbi:MAG TPA: SPOR domain-containing protein [Alphaproteobacteria bacterium]|nr:SPOR domain-containing protein [Alphaproteobacteria bacterium]
MNCVFRAILIGLCLLVARLPAAEASYETGLAAFERGDYAQALRDWLVEAEKGDARAQHNVAVIYDSGRGVTADPAEALRWYERAAAQGLPEAQNNLGMLYSRGRGTEADLSHAIELWTTAARSGYALAEFNLGLAYANAQGVPKDLTRARRLFEAAAAKKLPDAQFALGQVYHIGFGVDPDPREARRWFELAAARDYPGATEMLAKIDEEHPATKPSPEPQPQPAKQEEAEPLPEPQPQPAEQEEAEPSPTLAAATAPEAEKQGLAPPSDVQQTGLRLWLGSLTSAEKVEQQWRQMQESFGDLFQAMDLRVAEVERDQRKFYRLLAGPVPDRDRGREICRALQERDPEAWCKVVDGP